MGASSSKTSIPTSVHEDNTNISTLSTSSPRSLNGHYHYHGLATTQTQTQPHNDPEENDESSQKENMDAKKGLLSRAVPHGAPRSLPSPLPSKASHPGPTNENTTRPLSRAIKVNNSPWLRLLWLTHPFKLQNKAVSFRSPRKADPGYKNPSTTRTSLSQPEPSCPPVEEIFEESSQDSFAGDIYRDPAKQFVATARQFEVPLADLGRVSPPSGGMYKSAGWGGTSKGMYPNPRFSSPPEGNVLVESTPSLSGGSQSQASQPYDEIESGRQPDYMDLDLPPDRARVPSGHSSEEYLSDAPSSSYARHLDPDEYDTPLANPTDCPPTQPSTQVEEDHDASLPQPFTTNTTSSEAPPTTASSNIPPSRNILAMVDPAKRWRYQQYQQAATKLPQMQSHCGTSATGGAASSEETQPSTNADMMPPRQFPIRPHLVPTPPLPQKELVEATQPSCEDDERQNLPQRRFPARSHPTPAPTKKQISPKSSSSLVPTDDEHMDIVPDSEPTRATSPSRHTTNSPVKRLPRKVAPLSDSEPDVVPDSLALEDAEKPTNHHDSDMDVPLAAVIARQNKVKVQVNEKEEASPEVGQVRLSPRLASWQSSIDGTEQPSSRGKYTKQPAPPALPLNRKSSGPANPKGTQEVPSSVPQQDLVKPKGGRLARAPTGKVAKGKGPAIRERRKAKPPKSRQISTEHDDDSDAPNESDDEVSMKDEEVDSDGTDYVPQDPEPAAGPSRKRKRGVKPPKAVNKRKAKAPANTAHTPVTRQTKRLRAVASASRGGAKDATRVFALWKQDGYWYPGVVYSHEDGVRYMIKFDDEAEGYVTVDQMRVCDLQVGDDVMVTNSIVPRHHRSVKVADVSKAAKSNIISVRVDDEIMEVPIKALKIPGKSISFAWKERGVSQSSIITVVKPDRGKLSPASSGFTGTSGPSLRGSPRRLLEKTALVVTISGANDWEKEKECIMSAVKNNGGTVVNDWACIIRMDGKHSHMNNRWVIRKGDVEWLGKDDVERVFLLAGDASQKAKFLLALALGIPCLSVAWLHDSVEAVSNFFLAHIIPILT